MIEMYKTFLALGILGYAAIVDYKTMTVPNKLWKVMLPFALSFFVLELIVNNEYIAKLALNVLLVVGFLSLFYAAGWMGSADLKGLSLLALFFPHWHGNLLFIWLIILGSSVFMLPRTFYFLYQKHIVKDAVEADKYAPLYPYLVVGFILALAITPLT